MPMKNKTNSIGGEEDICKLFHSICNRKNLQLLSWGVKKVAINGYWHDFLAIKRLLTIEHMWRKYFMYDNGNILTRKYSR